MNDKDTGRNDMLHQEAVETQAVDGDFDPDLEPNGTRPEPSWGVITEGDPKTSLWETIKVAIRG